MTKPSNENLIRLRNASNSDLGFDITNVAQSVSESLQGMNSKRLRIWFRSDEFCTANGYNGRLVPLVTSNRISLNSW